MALDQEQKHKIVFLLGYTGKILIPTSTHFNKIVADRMENINDFIQDQVEELLTQIEVARAQMRNTATKGNVKRIDDIELDTTRGSSFVKKEYRRLLRELADTLDITLINSTGSRLVGVGGP